MNFKSCAKVSGIRPLTADETSRISGGYGPREQMLGLSPINVPAPDEGGAYMHAGFWGDALKTGAGVAGGYYAGQKATAEAANVANEKDISDRWLNPATGGGFAPGAPGQLHPLPVDSLGNMAMGALLNNGFVGYDRNGNHQIDYIVKPIWIDPAKGSVMTYSHGVWANKW